MRLDFWSQFVAGPEGAIATYWGHIKHSSIVANHPAIVQSELRHTVPIGLHGDGGFFSKSDSLFVLSWDSSVASSSGASEFANIFPFTIIRKATMTDETLDVLMRIFAWSVN